MSTDWSTQVELLRTSGAVIRPGLTDLEIAAVEARFTFRFPRDLRELLQTALPTGVKYPDWRDGSLASLQDWFDLPADGVLFDVERGFWLPEWGERPAGMPDAKRVASQLIAAAPKLIPVYAHRMMPDEPHDAGNPVFSVHQTDIICYGRTLGEYLHNEFVADDARIYPQDYRPIRFWDTDRFFKARWVKWQ